MASLERRGDRYRLVFRYAGQKHQVALKTTDEQEADDLLARVERKLELLANGELSLPDGGDISTFVVTDGRRAEKLAAIPRFTLEDAFKEYQAARRSIEATSLTTIKIHLAHFSRILKPRTQLHKLTFDSLQHYVNSRQDEGASPVTVRKEITSLCGVWAWALRSDKVTGVFPNRGLEYRKTAEKPPFQTWAEIERKIRQGAGDELWDCLFLGLKEIEGVLEYAQKNSIHDCFYPMVVMAAHTGARRSEILRSQAHDFDFAGKVVTIREKKRVRGQYSTRRVPLTPLLTKVMKNWFKKHSAGFTFLIDGHPLTPDKAHRVFQQTFAKSKWERVKGWHVFRHSFASNCAAKGTDQRSIDTWMGHQTEEQRRRYRHLFPDQQHKELGRVFS